MRADKAEDSLPEGEDQVAGRELVPAQALPADPPERLARLGARQADKLLVRPDKERRDRVGPVANGPVAAVVVAHAPRMATCLR